MTERSTASRRDAGRVNLHAIDATLDVHSAPTQDVPKRCHACSKGVGIALRNWSGLAKAILGLFFLPIDMHSGRAVAAGGVSRGTFATVSVLHSQLRARAVLLKFICLLNLHHLYK